jgi:hypothetical protein
MSITETREARFALARELDVERNAERLFVQCVSVTEAPVIEELFAVVGRQDDERIVVQTLALERREQLSELVGGVANRGVVLIHETPHVRSGDAGAAREVLAPGDGRHVPAVVDELATRGPTQETRSARVRHAIGTVRVHRVQVQEEGLARRRFEPRGDARDHFFDVRVGGRGAQKVVEVIEALVVTRLARDVVIERVRDRVPPLARQCLGERLELLAELRAGAIDAVTRGEEPGEDGSGARAGPRRRRVGAREPRRPSGEPVQSGGGGAGVSEVVQVIGAQRVDHDEDHVGPPRSRAHDADQKHSDENYERRAADRAHRRGTPALRSGLRGRTTHATSAMRAGGRPCDDLQLAVEVSVANRETLSPVGRAPV